MIAFPDNGGRVSIDGGDSLEALLQPDILEGLDSKGSSMSTSEVVSREVTREPRHSDTSDTQRLLEAKPQPPADIRPSGRATLGVERIVLRGQDVPVETVWTAEVPRAPDDFSVDVRDKTLGPGESYPVTVSVFKDEVVETRDVLNVMVIEGKDFTIPLRAVGTGSLTTCDEVDVDNRVRMGALVVLSSYWLRGTLRALRSELRGPITLLKLCNSEVGYGGIRPSSLSQIK